MDPEDPERTRREKVAVGLTTECTNHPRTTSRWPRTRNHLYVAVVISIFIVLIMILSSAIPSSDSWHGFPQGSGVTTDSTSSQMSPSSFYPYLANPGQYPVADPLSLPTPSGPASITPASNCIGPIVLTALDFVSGTLPPDGCALYTFVVSESTWSTEVSDSNLLDVNYATLSYGGSQPAFEVYQTIGEAPTPTEWTQSTLGPSPNVAVQLSSSHDAQNVQGGWGTYEWLVVAGGSSTLSYWFGVHWGDYGDGPNSYFTARIGVASESSTLAVNLSAIISEYDGPGPYVYSWAFGDGTTSTLQDPTHTYSKGGSYTVSLSAKDNSGQYSNSTLNIGVQSKAAPVLLSYPHLASAVENSIPTYMLIDSATAPSNISYLYFSKGTYNATDAGSIYNGTASSDLPIQWSTASVVASFSAPINGDDIVATPDGAMIFIAVSSGDSTWIFESTTGGSGWFALTPQALEGQGPSLALAPTEILVATWLPGEFPSSVYMTTLSFDGYGANQNTDIELYGETIVGYAAAYATGTGSGTLGTVLSLNTGSILYYRSTDNGYYYSSVTIGSYQNSTTSPILDSVGDTLLADNDASVGTLTVATEDSNVFVLYTSNIAGRTAVNVTTSGNGGQNWNPTMTYHLQAGSIRQPEAVASPAGYVYVTWTDDSEGTPGVDQAVFLADGRIAQNATELPGSGGPHGMPASLPTVTIDPLMRPVYAWVAAGGTSAPTLEASGAFLSPSHALGLLSTSFHQLTTWDFKPPRSGAPTNSTQSNGTAAFVSASQSLAAALRDPASGACSLSASQTNVSEVYSTSTTFPLIPVVTSTSSCANLTPAEHPTSEVASTSGPFAPSTYLSVLGDWLYEGVGVQVSYQGDALAASLGSAVGLNNATADPLPPVDGSVTISTSGDVWTYSPDALSPQPTGEYAQASATPFVINPTTARLELSVSFPALILLYPNESVVCGGTSPNWFYNTTTVYSSAVEYMWTGEADGVSGVISSTGLGPQTPWDLPSPVYLTNLTPQASISWGDSYSAMYDTYTHVVNQCTGYNQQTLDGSYFYSLPDSYGTLYTNLSMVPGAPGGTFVKATGQSSTENLGFEWNNTMLATAATSLTASNGSKTPHGSGIWSVPESFSYPNVPSGANYTASMSVTSQVGIWNATQEPSISAGEDTYSNPLTANFGCSFPLEKNPVYQTNPVILSNPATNKVTVIWLSSVIGPSWLQYYELGVGLNWTQTASLNSSYTPSAPLGSEYPYEYSVELQGLAAASLYGVTAWNSYVAVPGCLSYEASSSAVFVSPEGFQITEWDHPYDSITGEGGGASLGWSVAPGFATNGVFLNGTLFYENDTSKPSIVIVPIEPSVGLTQSGTTYLYNLTLPQLNTSYTAWVQLNYSVSWASVDGTINGKLMVASTPCNFTYQQDTSGDGLTNLEKILGWTVTTTNLVGQTSVQDVTANPQEYATNGLVSDYLEKEYGLNPNTVDTAGSHMLDTWNLTFNVGLVKNSPKLPSTSLFEYWYENATYDPFGSGKPSAQNKTANLTANPVGGQSSGDGSAAASKILWSKSALGTFENLSGVQATGWLRAVTGAWKGVRTLTVEGKLSWGANPLATSTSGDGVPDGAQVNPLGGTDLQVTITNWTDTAKAKGNGVAAFISANSSATSYSPARVDYAGYSRQITAGSGGSADFPGSSKPATSVVTFPVIDTEQFAYLNLSLVQNESTSSSPDTVYAIASTSHYQVNLTSYAVQSLSYPSAGANPSISFEYQVEPVFARAPTWILAPANNSTLSPLPTGLSRYTAEQDFDLLVLNDISPAGTSPTTITMGGVLGPQLNWKYPVTLLPGLNDLLVPRAMFLASPLGQTLVNATTLVGIPSKHQDPALTFNPWNWYPRVLNTTGNFHSQSFISVFANTSGSYTGTNPSEFGGVSSNPAIESGYESRQVQAVFWINVSSSGYNSNLTTGAAELTNLLGGLLLNTSGNLTGDLINATAELPTLGLSPNVLTALSNYTYRNDGAYGTPVSKSQKPASPEPWWSVVASDIWNAVSGVVTVVAKLVSVIWNATVAAATYLADAGAALASRLGITSFLSQTATALRAVGSAMWSALDQLLNDVIKPALEALFDVALGPFFNAVDAYASGVDSAVDPTGPVSVWMATSGPVFQIGFVVAVVLEVALSLAFTVFYPAASVVGLMFGLIAGVGLSIAMLLIPGISSISSSMVDQDEAWAAGYTSQSSVSTDWTSWGNAISYWESGPSNSWAASVLTTSQENPGLMLPSALAFAIASLGMTWYASHGGGLLASVSATVFATISWYLAFRAASYVEEIQPLGAIDDAVQIADALTIGWDSFELIRGL